MGAHLRTAAVEYRAGDDVDAALSAAVAKLLLADVKVGGFRQRCGEQFAPGKPEMLLDVLPCGGTIRAARGCRAASWMPMR